MSKQSLQRNIVKRLEVAVGEFEEKTVGVAARTILQSKRASQCFVFSGNALNILAAGFENSAGLKLTPNQQSQYKKALSEHIKTWHQSRLPAAINNNFWNRLMQRHGLVWRHNIVYTGTTFRTIKDRLHAFNKAWGMQQELLIDDKSYDRKSFGTDLDHGITDTGTGILGAGAATGAMASNEFGNKESPRYKYFTAEFNKSLERVVNTTFPEESSKSKRIIQERIFSIVVNWDQIAYKNGRIKAKAGVIITPDTSSGNQGKAGFEKKEINALYKAIGQTFQQMGAQKYIDTEGSSSYKDKVEKVTIEAFNRKVKGNKNVKTKSTAKGKLATSTKVTKKTKPGKGAAAVPAGRKSAGGGTRGKQDKKENRENLFTIANLINAQLHDVLEKNMTEPGLVYRTGRFANSVKIIGTSRTPRGFARFDYTYQKNPYQVFSAGGAAPWNTPERWPNLVIERSIREVAAQYALGRFFVRGQ